MSKKGVSAISGITAPTVGEKYIYNIVSWYPGTPQSERNLGKVTWELFKKRKNGTFTTTNIKKMGHSEFTFGEATVGQTYKLQAYLYEPEGGGLIISPKPAKIPKINKVELFYIDDKKGMIFSFMEKLRARAYCVNMLGKELIFTLWEDDTKGAGHNSKNLPVATLKVQVNKDGWAAADFPLSTFMFKAAMGEKDSTLEFYVTVEYFKDKKHASGNVDVKNPYPPIKHEILPKPTDIPKAKGSPAEQKSPSKKEEKGIWDSFTESISKKGELWDWAESMGTVIKDKMPTVQKPDGKSPAVVKAPANATKGSCICQQQYKDLFWGEKVSCEFRKKVVEISKRLGKDPNLLMAGMALETGRTFSPTAGKGTSYVGLIQFGDDAAESVGTTKEKLLEMTAVQQLVYVEKYLTKKKDKINTLTDFYLSILMPVDVGKGNQPNFAVFDNKYPLAYKKDGKTLTDLSKSRHYGYRQNPAFLYEKDERKRWEDGGKKKYDGEGKTYIWEIEKSINKFYEEGKSNKVKTFECQKKQPESIEPTLDKGTWNVIITEHYTGNKCTHIERTEIRSNCRRGKIEVYDHNQKIVLTFKDCLLEGIAGEDHMKTNSDVPFGDFQINQTTPFYHSTVDNKKSYGPNPRLVFEPISGNSDEAAKSGRSAIRIHGGRQVGYEIKTLKRTQGCIRVWDDDAKALYDWWEGFRKSNPSVKPGKVTIKK